MQEADKGSSKISNSVLCFEFQYKLIDFRESVKANPSVFTVLYLESSISIHHHHILPLTLS